MAKPKIRHIAIMARDPEELAKFYEEVFEMEVVHRSKGQHGIPAVFMTDGYISLALLPCALQGESTVGINHFGFKVDDVDEMSRRLIAASVEDPKKRPSDRPYAEYRAADPQGNLFDLSEHGFDDAENDAERAARKKKSLVDA